MSSTDRRRNVRGYGSRLRRKERCQDAALCNDAPALFPIPGITVTPCLEEGSQHGGLDKAHGSALPVDVTHLAPPPFISCKEPISSALQIPGRTRKSRYGSEQHNDGALYPAHAVVNLPEVPTRPAIGFEYEVPSQRTVPTDSEGIVEALDQRQDSGSDQAVDPNKKGLKNGMKHGMSKNVWRRHCKKMQSQSLATKTPTGLSDKECFSGIRLLPLPFQSSEDVPDVTSRSKMPQTATQTGSNVLIEPRPEKITVAHIKELTKSMPPLRPSSSLGGHHQWGSRIGNGKNNQKGGQSSKLDPSTSEGFAVIISRGNIRKSRYVPGLRRPKTTYPSKDQIEIDPSTMQQPVGQRDSAAELSSVQDFAKETSPHQIPRPTHTTPAQPFTRNNSKQADADEEDMSRYTIPELQSYKHSALPISPELSHHMNSTIESRFPHKGTPQQRSIQARTTGPDKNTTDPGSLITRTSPKVADTVATPTSLLTSRDINRGQVTPRHKRIMVSDGPRGKWVTPAPSMTKPSQVNASTAASTTVAPTTDAAERKIVVNLPSSSISPQTPSNMTPVNEQATPHPKIVHASLLPQSSSTPEPNMKPVNEQATPHPKIVHAFLLPQGSSTPEPSKEQETPATTVAQSSIPLNKALLSGSSDKRVTTSTPVGQPFLAFQTSSAMEISNENDTSSMAVVQPSDTRYQDITSINDVRIDSKSEVVSHQLHEATIPQAVNPSPTHPALVVDKTEQLKIKRNSNWPSKRSLKGNSTYAHPGSNDWGSASPGELNNNKAADNSMGGWPVEQHYESQLAGWDGNFQPPPVEWDARPAFNSTDKQKKEHLEEWMAVVVANGTKTVDTKQAIFADGTAHTAITEEGALALVIPPKPEEAPLDRGDEESVAKQMQTAESSALKYSNRALVHEKDKKKRNKDYAIAIAEQKANYVPPPNPHAPKAKIYLRPAGVADLKAIAELYRHYIEKTVCVPEREFIDEHVMRERLASVQDSKLPWLVAVELIHANGRRYERIVGFGFAEDYTHSRTAYRYTVELEFYVHHQSLRLGIGKCLMDKLMSCLDPTYMPRGGYNFYAGNDDLKYREGGMRVISKVLINFPYDQKDDKTVKWLGDWMGQWDFKRMGTLEGIGFKMDKQ
ncbi:MAG: hypothetical protein M1812_002084 [Candelaria pacifica]|nr:MAG: hypothetical protein M1812_002084 [Candelaria pacifica]